MGYTGVLFLDGLGSAGAAVWLSYYLRRGDTGPDAGWRPAFAAVSAAISGYLVVRPWVEEGLLWAVLADVVLGALAAGALVWGARLWNGGALDRGLVDPVAASVVLTSVVAQAGQIVGSDALATAAEFRSLRLAATAGLAAAIVRRGMAARSRPFYLALVTLAAAAAGRFALEATAVVPGWSHAAVDTVGGLAWTAAAFVVAVRLAGEKAAEIASEHAARFDPVSGLLRREPFIEQVRALTRSASGGEGVGLVFLDLDRFRAVNESMGHASGDQALAEVGRRLGVELPRGSVVARLGGDEFSIAVPAIAGPEQALELARRVAARVGEPFAVAGGEVALTVTSGVSFFPGDAEDATALLDHAHAAASAAKSQGRGRGRLYSIDGTPRLAGSAEKEMRLRRALALGEIWVYYQPRVDLRTGKIDGFEALARWLHPSEGLLAAAGFIELAETTGLVVPIGYHVLREACGRAQDARVESGEPLTVSVNLSPQQIADAEIIERVEAALADSKLPPTALELEVTEAAAMQDVAQARRVLTRLRSMGVKIALDDFGTGHSALGYLKELPVDRVKIDKCFVRDIATDARDRFLIRTIVDLARARDLEVTAEGVESLRQARFLARVGCDHAQGYLLGSPRPSPELATLAGSRPIGSGFATGPIPRRRLRRPVPVEAAG